MPRSNCVAGISANGLANRCVPVAAYGVIRNFVLGVGVEFGSGLDFVSGGQSACDHDTST